MSLESNPNNYLIETKISIPIRASNIITRHQLMQELEESLDKKLVFISAMSGYGKTSFLSSWFDPKNVDKRQAAWFSLDSADNDPVRFLRYMIYSFQKIDADLGSTTLKELENGQIFDFVVGLSELISEINQKNKRFWIVLDDVHVINNPVIWKGLFDLVQWIQPGVQVIFSGRNSLPDSFSILRVRNSILEITATDLRFSLFELKEFFEKETGKVLPEDVLRDLDKRFQGWAAGLQLAVLVFKKNNDSFDGFYHFDGSHPYFYQFLFEEVLSGLSESVLNFLLMVSPLEIFCLDLCHYLDPSTDLVETISVLNNSDLLIQKDQAKGEWFSLHPLITDALTRKLNRQSPAIAEDILKKAMIWHSQNGDVNLAIEYGIKGQHWQDVVRLLTSIPFPILIKERQWATISRWIESLPHEIREGSPLLVIRYAFSQMLLGNFLFTSEFINRFKTSYIKEDFDPPTEFYNAFAFALSNTDEIQLMVDFALLALQNTSYSTPHQYGVAKTLFAAGLIGKGNILEAGKILLEVFSMENEIDFPDLFFFAHKMQALIHIYSGRLSLAKDVFEEIKKGYLKSSNSGIGHLVDSLTYIGKIYYEWNDLELSKKFFFDALSICERENNQLFKITPLAYLARINHIQGKTQRSEQILDELTTISRNVFSETMRRKISAHMTWINLQRGEVVLAENWLIQIKDNFSPGNLTDRNLEKRVAVRVFIKLGEFTQADDLLQDLLTEAKESGRHGDMVELLVLSAILDQARGNIYQAIKSLKHGLNLGRPGGFTRIYLDEGQPMLQLLRRSFQGNEQDEQVLDLLHSLDESMAEKTALKTRTYSYSTVDDQNDLYDPLSNREIDVLRLASKGMSNKEIAEQLSISTGTAKLHMHNICQKLNVQNRHQACAKARSFGIIPE